MFSPRSFSTNTPDAFTEDPVELEKLICEVEDTFFIHSDGDVLVNGDNLGRRGIVLLTVGAEVQSTGTFIELFTLRGGEQGPTGPPRCVRCVCCWPSRPSGK
jgi:hypothetical protein